MFAQESEECPGKCHGQASEMFRERWGCDQDTKYPTRSIICHTCRGTGCSRCKDSGTIDLHRCTTHYMEGDLPTAMAAYCAFSSHGTLPCGGGLMQQTAWFHDLIRTVNSERGAIETEERRLQKAKNG